MQKGGRHKIGDILLSAKAIKDDDLKKGLQLQKQKGIQLGKALILMGVTSQDQNQDIYRPANSSLQNSIVGLFSAYLIAALFEGGKLLLKGKLPKGEIPFGPYLALGALTGLFWGDELAGLYMSWFWS